jgi:hypothetical protein
MKTTGVLAAIAALLITKRHAAVGQIGQVNANQGAKVVVPISLAGDGITVGAEIQIRFDNARLSLSVTSGILVGAGISGAACARTTLNTVVVLTGVSSVLMRRMKAKPRTQALYVAPDA